MLSTLRTLTWTSRIAYRNVYRFKSGIVNDGASVLGGPKIRSPFDNPNKIRRVADNFHTSPTVHTLPKDDGKAPVNVTANIAAEVEAPVNVSASNFEKKETPVIESTYVASNVQKKESPLNKFSIKFLKVCFE